MNRKKQNGQTGQSLVELAIGFLLVLTILLGLLDLGRLYFYYIALEDSAGEAALYLSIAPFCPGPPEEGYPSQCEAPNNARYRAEHVASESFDWSKARMSSEIDPPGGGVGSTVTVTIKYPFTLLTPVISDIVGDDTIILTAVATRTVVSERHSP